MGVLGQSRDQGAASVAPPALGPVDRTGFFANVGAGFRQAVAGPHSTRVGDAIAEKKLYDQVITALAQEGEQGEDTLTITAQPTKVKRSFRNPYVSQPWENLLNPSYNPITSLYGGGDAGEKKQIWEAVARVRARKPDFLKGFADEGALSAYALQQRQKQIAAAGAVTERAGTLGTVGAFVGGAGGSVASLDPENVVGGGFGTAAGKTFARTVIRRATEGAAVNAAAAVVGLPGQAADANHLGQEMTPGDMAHQVGEAALIGGALGGAPHLVPKVAGKVTEAVGAVAGKVAENLPAGVRDPLVAASIRAGTVKDRDLLHEYQRLHNPYGAVDTATPDEKAAAHTLTRDIDNRETSPLHPEAVAHNENRLQAMADSLGVALTTPDLPSPAPIQHPTTRAAPTTYEKAVHSAEGTGKNTDSSADGHFQFTKGTWLEYAPRVRDTAGMSNAQILALRHDLPTATAAERLFRADNSRYLRDRGLEDTPGNLSLAHFLGKADAAKVLRAAPDTPIERLVDPASLRANRKVLEGKSASEVIAWAHKRIGAAVDMPVARADAVPDADGLDAEDYSDTPYERATLHPDDITTDAELMQYKSGGDENGVTGKLANEPAWDPIRSGELLVWEGNDGRRVLVDGHQRLDLAKREGVEEVPSIVLREGDGITPEMARAIGAMRNVNLGTGTLEDNAKVLADMPEAADALKGAPTRADIEAVAQLPYEQFGEVLNGANHAPAEFDADPVNAIASLPDEQFRALGQRLGVRSKFVDMRLASRFLDNKPIKEVRAAYQRVLESSKELAHAEEPLAGTAEASGLTGEPPRETGSRDAAAEADRVLSERNEPSLFEHAVAAKAAAEPFSDPVGEGAKQQTALLDHDLQMDAAAEDAPSLFDVPETGYRLSEEGEARPLKDVLDEAESDSLAAKALRDCLTGGEA
jgi:hypothetical protein